MKTRLAILRLIAIALLGITTFAQAETITVNSGADSGGSCPGADCTLRQAILTAAAGDTIDFGAVATIDLTSAELLIDKNLTIIGPGAKLLTVQRNASASANFRIFNISGAFNVSISDLTIANGALINDSGCGIANNGGTLTLTNAAISANTGGGYSDGGGIGNFAGTLNVSNSTISGNSAYNGGGIYNAAGSLTTIANSTISGNEAVSGGGIYTEGTVTVTNGTVSGNASTQSFGAGGGILNSGGTVNARDTIIGKNVGSPGPDVYGDMTTQGYNLVGNSSGATITPANQTGDQIGGGPKPIIDPMLGPLQDNGGPTFTQALLSGSTAIEGGGAATDPDPATGHSAIITDQRGFARPVDSPSVANASGGDGSDIGAYEVQADQLPGCSNLNRIVKNNNGGGTDSLRDVIANVCAGSTITFAANVRGAIDMTGPEMLITKSLTIAGPGANLLSVQRSASAITNFRIFDIAEHLIVSISGLTIANGSVPGNVGGGISNSNSTLNLAYVTISGNTADIGAGIYTTRAATITNSTISGNTISGNVAGDGGGGIFNQGTLSLTNSTLSANKAQTSGGGGRGGAIYNSLGAVSLINSTISANQSDFGGGIFNSAGTVKSKNTIIALNISPSGPDFNGPLVSQGFNLVGDYSGATISPAQFSDQLGVSSAQLNLGPLQFNGGPTRTHALLSGSVAIDQGDSSGSGIDQRGFKRPFGSPPNPNPNGSDGSDIGAFEYGADAIFANGFELPP